MAIFSKREHKKSEGLVTQGATIIASGTKIKGDLTLSTSLHVDGEIEGVINSDNVVTIGTKGKVNGDIVAKGLVINGFFKGSAESDSVEIQPSGDVTGKLTYGELTIEKGANFEGETIFRSASIKDSNVAEFDAHKKKDDIFSSTEDSSTEEENLVSTFALPPVSKLEAE